MHPDRDTRGHPRSPHPPLMGRCAGASPGRWAGLRVGIWAGLWAGRLWAGLRAGLRAGRLRAPAGTLAAGRAVTLGLVLAVVLAVVGIVPAPPQARGESWIVTDRAAGSNAHSASSGSRGHSGSSGSSAPVAPAPPASSAHYVLPLPAPGADRPSRASLLSAGILLHDFAGPTSPWGAGHRGVDLATAPGAAVLAPGAGTVTFAGVVVDRPLVVITHLDGRRSTLEPVTTDLRVGAQVDASDVVGVVAVEASTHCAPESCLHWGVRSGTRPGAGYVDPLALLGAVEAVILLPLR